MRPWYETAYRWGQTNLTEDDPLSCDLDFWRKQWKRTYLHGIIANAGGIVAFYPSRFDLQHRAQGVGDGSTGRDLFGEFAQAAKEDGLFVVARMDINRASKDFYDAHPSWFAMDKEGRPIMVQGRYISCVSSGYYSEYIPNVLREVIEKYRPVGFADNSWKGLGRGVICYCDNCKKSFGGPLPESVDWDDPIYKKWYKWGVARRTELWDLFNKTTAETGGPDCLWMGMLPGDPHNMHGSLADTYELCKRSKIIFCDHQGRESDFSHNAMIGSMLRMASHENILVPESMANYVRGGRTFRLAANPARETQLWSASGMAGGISPWYHHISAGRHDRRQFETPVPIFEWHKKNEKYLYNRKDLAQIGLVWSQENSDFHGRGDRDKVVAPFDGFARALTMARLPYMPINAADIGKYANRLKVLILPEVALLSDKQVDDVCSFVRNGGGLVFSGEADSRIFKLAGVEPTDEYKGTSVPKGETWDEYDGHNYLLLPKERHEILTAFKDTDIIPFGGRLRVAKGNAIAGYVPSFPIYPPEFAYIREREPETGTIFANSLENGARVVYLAADIDRCYGRHGLPDHGRLLADIALWAQGGERLFTVEGPGLLDCRIYSQPGRVIVHIVNLSGTNRFGYCDETYPVGPITVKYKKAKVKREEINLHDMIIFEE